MIKYDEILIPSINKPSDLEENFSTVSYQGKNNLHAKFLWEVT